MSKPNKDGWIRHRGGKCPVEAGEPVDVRYRDGTVGVGLRALRDYNFDTDHHSGWDADEEYWSHENLTGDIMAWRPHKPDSGMIAFHGAELIPVLDNPGEPNDALKEVLELDAPKPIEQRILEADQAAIARYADDPRNMRDRIREIDATTIALNEERAYLVAKLKAEGFMLVDEPNSVDESAQQDIAQQDMSDAANWKVGDLVKSVNDEADDIMIGGIYPLWKEPDVDQGYLYLVDSDGDKRNRCIEDYAFHSRPPQ